MQNNADNTKTKIISILKIRGPSLPVQIASQTGLNSLFAGAFLSELANEKTIKISNMKVGGSPLYFLKGQEHLLENFHQYLPGKEREAFLLLKENKILEDKKQFPAIRVALRNIKDFAFPFLKDNEVMWRFHSVTEEQVREILEPKKVELPKKKIGLEQPKIKAEPQKIKVEVKRKIKTKEETSLSKEKQLDIGLKKLEQKQIPIEKQEIKKQLKKQKEKSEFVLKIINFLRNQQIEVLEERELKKKEFSGVIRVDSTLGKIKFFCIAKDKKNITENDLRLALQKSQALKMPSLILHLKEPNKKTLEYAEKWSSLLKLKKIE